jgi:hypothetical protein
MLVDPINTNLINSKHRFLSYPNRMIMGPVTAVSHGYVTSGAPLIYSMWDWDIARSWGVGFRTCLTRRDSL